MSMMNRDTLFPLFISILTILATKLALPINGDKPIAALVGGDDTSYRHQQLKPMEALKLSMAFCRQLATGGDHDPSPVSIPPSPRQSRGGSPRVYEVIAYGADPTGTKDSTDAFSKVLSDLVKAPISGTMLHGIKNFGGAQINLAGGTYLISEPLQFPTAHVGNVMIVGGTLRASNNFPTNGYLIDLSTSTSSVAKKYDYEYITLRDLMLDSNFRGGGVFTRDAARIVIDNCYITHFTTEGISIHGGLDNLVRNTFIGQHITNGSDPNERNFSGTGINLNSGDNAITNVIIFSASVGIVISGAANILTGVHCYNKHHRYGGIGIYIKLRGRAETHILGSYLDFAGIVVEDPVQLTISNSFFLEAFIVFKSTIGVARGVNVVNNMFAALEGDIVRLDGNFKDIDNVVVEGNTVGGGINLKATVAQRSAMGSGTSWMVDFNKILLFPSRITHAQYTLSSIGSEFPRHTLRNVTGNRVVVESDIPVTATVFVTVRQ